MMIRKNACMVAALLLLCFVGHAQTDVQANRVIVRNALFLKDWWITGIQRDTSAAGFGDAGKVPTAQAVKDYVSNVADSVQALSTVGLATKVNTADTAAMMLPYARVQRLLDSVANIKTSIGTKTNTADTAAMLLPYARAQRLLDSVANLKVSIGTKTNTADTAAMLLPYARVQRLLDSVTNIKTSIGTKTNNADTAAMLLPYARVQRLLDSVTNIKTSIGTKTNNADTAAMLLPYARVQRLLDSVTNIKTSIGTKQNILTITTTGSTGAATLMGATLNIPQYTGGNLGNTDLALTAARTLTLSTYPLTIVGTTRTRFFANGRMTIGDTTNSGYKLEVIGEDAKINGLRIGLGAGQSATNTVLGLNALTVNSASFHVAIGANALAANTTGNGNVGIGYNALKISTTQGDQVGIGYEAMSSAKSEASIGIGTNALRYATGASNTAIGWNALSSNIAGNSNVAIGWNAANANTSGNLNTVVGYNAFRTNTTGGGSTFMGYLAGKSGTYNCGFGADALTNATGDNNVSVGRQSGYAITTGANNICIGGSAGQYLTTQSNIIVISSLNNNTLAEDQARSAFYVQQNVTTASQIVTLNGNVAVNTIAPASTAVMDITSTTKGFLPPRMTTTQRLAISSPAESLEVYDLTLHKLYVWDGTVWQAAW